MPASSYRLSGTTMESWAGKRVQITGTLIPVTGNASSQQPRLPEFRVQSIQPAEGDCP